MPETPYPGLGEQGVLLVGTRAASAGNAGSTATFIVPIPHQGQWLCSLMALSNSGTDRRASALLAVTYVESTPGSGRQLAATVLHAAYTTEVTAITVGTPSASGHVAVTVTFAAGTNGSVDAYWRRMLSQQDFAIGRFGGPLPNTGKVMTASGVVDTFTRADSATTLGNAETGQAWTARVGTWGISSNQAYSINGGGGDMATLDTGAADMVVSVTLAAIAGSAGILARYTDANNWYLLQSFGGNLRLLKKVAGSLNIISIGSNGVSAGQRITLSVIGATLTVKRDGATVATVTDTGLTTGNHAGIVQLDAGAGARWDDFAALAA